jgi:hypothetical protein
LLLPILVARATNVLVRASTLVGASGAAFVCSAVLRAYACVLFVLFVLFGLTRCAQSSRFTSWPKALRKLRPYFLGI